MSGWGEFNYKEFKEYADNLKENLKQNTSEAFLRDIMNEIGRIAIANLKENTPVGQYDDGYVEFTATGKDGEPVGVRFFASHHGKQGGNLRDSWFISDVDVSGGTAMLTLANSAYYAEWVEKGHRIVRNGSTIGWVEGQFFVKTTLEELEKLLKPLIEPKYIEYLERLLG